MIEFYINGQQVEVQLEDEQTIGDVLKSFEKTCEENEAAVIGITVDGKQITAELFDDEAAKALGKDTKFEFSIVTKNDIKAAFSKLSELFNELALQMEGVPVALQSGKNLEVSESIKKLADSIDQFCHIATLASLFPDTFTPASVNGINFKEFFADFAPILKDNGIRIPKNLVVIGTVHMDETTFSFSRKVLDRAMSFELTDVEPMYTVQSADKIEWGTLIGRAEQRYVSAEDLYFRAPDPDTAAKNKELGEKVLASLKKINDFLDDTPFKIAYRSRNEIMLYCIERTARALPMLPKALDEAISMKILSRVEGDEQRLSEKWFEELSKVITDQINDASCTICSKKINEMRKQLGRGYASFWTR